MGPAIALTLGLLLSACGPNDDAKNSAEKSKMEAEFSAEQALMADPERAGPELERRLMENINVQDGLLIVRAPIIGDFESFVLPTTAPWVLRCGIGLKFVFGSSFSGEGSSIDSEVQTTLTTAIIDKQNCAVLGPRLGKRLKALLQSAQSTP